MKYCLCGCGDPVFSHKYGRRCQYKRTDQKWIDSQNRQREKKKGFSTIKQKPREATGEGALFSALINSLPHVSFISGLPITDISHRNCAHVIPKAQNKYPKFKLLDRNIKFLTNEEHFLYDHGTEAQREKYAVRIEAENGLIVDWKKLYDLKDQLIKEYKEKFGN